MAEYATTAAATGEGEILATHGIALKAAAGTSKFVAELSPQGGGLGAVATGDTITITLAGAPAGVTVTGPGVAANANEIVFT